MRQLLIEVRRGQGEAILNLAQKYQGANLSQLEANTTRGAIDLVIAYLGLIRYLAAIAVTILVDKRNFRKKILKMNLLRELDEIQTDVAHRAARLYQFDEAKYQQLKQQGFNFEL